MEGENGIDVPDPLTSSLTVGGGGAGGTAYTEGTGEANDGKPGLFGYPVLIG
jgi:hypothetical protein